MHHPIATKATCTPSWPSSQPHAPLSASPSHSSTGIRASIAGARNFDPASDHRSQSPGFEEDDLGSLEEIEDPREPDAWRRSGRGRRSGGYGAGGINDGYDSVGDGGSSEEEHGEVGRGGSGGAVGQEEDSLLGSENSLDAGGNGGVGLGAGGGGNGGARHATALGEQLAAARGPLVSDHSSRGRRRYDSPDAVAAAEGLYVDEEVSEVSVSRSFDAGTIPAGTGSSFPATAGAAGAATAGAAAAGGAASTPTAAAGGARRSSQEQQQQQSRASASLPAGDLVRSSLSGRQRGGDDGRGGQGGGKESGRKEGSGGASMRRSVEGGAVRRSTGAAALAQEGDGEGRRQRGSRDGAADAAVSVAAPAASGRGTRPQERDREAGEAVHVDPKPPDHRSPDRRSRRDKAAGSGAEVGSRPGKEGGEGRGMEPRGSAGGGEREDRKRATWDREGAREEAIPQRQSQSGGRPEPPARSQSDRCVRGVAVWGIMGGL